MCLILFSYLGHPDYSLIVAANRDEFYSRPSLPVAFWPEAPSVLAGRDLEQGGTWLGVTRQGRFAALTNYRDPAINHLNVLSRGHLAAEYLKGNLSPTEYIERIRLNSKRYNGFNLLLGDTSSLWHYSNVTNVGTQVSPGIHGLSNHLLDTQWPKVTQGKGLLKQTLSESVDEKVLFELLRNDRRPIDKELPNTGVGLEWERVLSSMFIATAGYGTRAMSVLTISRDRVVRFSEESRNDIGDWNSQSYQFNLVE